MTYEFGEQANDEDTFTNGPLKAYLYWVTRDHDSLGWFIDAMKEISQATQKQVTFILLIYLIAS